MYSSSWTVLDICWTGCGPAVRLAVSLVSANPIPNERRLPASSTSVLFLKWQPTKDRYRVTLDATDQRSIRRRPSKGKATGKRHATKKVCQNQKTRPKKKEARGKSPKKPPRIFAHQTPSSKCGRLVGTHVQLMYVLDPRKGFHKGLLAVMVRLPIQNRMSISSGRCISSAQAMT